MKFLETYESGFGKMGCGVYSPVCQLRQDLDPPVRERCQPWRYPPWPVPTTTHGKSVFSEGDIEHSFLKTRPQLNMPLGILRWFTAEH